MPPVLSICSLFSMDGDFARLKDLAALRKRYGFLLILDEVSPAWGTATLALMRPGQAEKVGKEMRV